MHLITENISGPVSSDPLLEMESSSAMIAAARARAFAMPLESDDLPDAPKAHGGALQALAAKADLTKEERALLEGLDEFNAPYLEEKLTTDGVVTGPEDYGRRWAEFKKFAFLAGRSRRMGRTLAMASKAVDELWHQFILFTPQYRRFCQERLGFFLDHVPEMREKGLRRSSASEDFFSAYGEVFGPPAAMWFPKGRPVKTGEKGDVVGADCNGCGGCGTGSSCSNGNLGAQTLGRRDANCCGTSEGDKAAPAELVPTASCGSCNSCSNCTSGN
jgi:hypothetical protein